MTGRPRAQQGMALIEALIASAVLGIGLVGATQLALKTLHMASASRQHTVAQHLAQEAMDCLHARTAPDFWTTLARRLSDTLHQGDFESGLALAIEEIGLLLHQHYPDDGRTHNENELPNAVVLL